MYTHLTYAQHTTSADVPGCCVHKPTLMIICRCLSHLCAAVAVQAETQTLGMGDLLERSRAYRAEGARFAKWRAVLRIDASAGLPSHTALALNAAQLAQYAAISQVRPCSTLAHSVATAHCVVLLLRLYAMTT
jgi:Fructose-bisphosphate aldolase class-I